jgi:hypothetical protein
MNESINIIDVPSYDFLPYLNASIKYVIEHFPIIIPIVKTLIGYLNVVAIVISVVCFFGIIYCVEKLKRIRIKEGEIYDAKVDMGYSDVVPTVDTVHPALGKKWDMVLQHVESANPNDWRQAILEADIILGEVLSKLGYKGVSIGEQLKRANKGEFKSLDDAWEAHKVRNELAHAGSDYPFSQFEARRVVQQYRKVFEEFYII